tara:strand:+ start:635 stop:1384 length:750 start_codon:yes stop_codon:yes gene_type:complete
MNILQLSHYLDELLDIQNIPDSPNAFNGLQVESTGKIQKTGLAVDVCSATIRMAIEKKCNVLIVHHGLFWSGTQLVRGQMFEKLSALICNNIALYSVHVPLDVHPILGNNRALADMISLKHLEAFGEYRGIKIGLKGTVKRQSAEDLGKTLQEKLGSPVRVIGCKEVEKVSIVSGAAGDMVGQASTEGLDAHITGECGHHNFHQAEEGECVLILGGHYATETGGVKAVGKHLEEKFDIESEFLNYPTGL